MTPWPRKLRNFPIILMAVVQQYLVAFSVIIDEKAKQTTATHILDVIFPNKTEGLLLILAATMACLGFRMKNKIDNVLMLLPQQLLLYLSAGGAIEAIWRGHFADGVERSHAFLLVDQCPLVLIAFFHSWALMLILKYGEDK
jgi:hypothetical protein